MLFGEALHKEFEPDETVKAECQITCFQDQYFYTNSFEEAKDKLRYVLDNSILGPTWVQEPDDNISFHLPCRKYAKSIKRPFELSYDPFTQTVEVLDTPKQVALATRSVMERLGVINSAMDKLEISS